MSRPVSWAVMIPLVHLVHTLRIEIQPVFCWILFCIFFQFVSRMRNLLLHFISQCFLCWSLLSFWDHWNGFLFINDSNDNDDNNVLLNPQSQSQLDNTFCHFFIMAHTHAHTLTELWIHVRNKLVMFILKPKSLVKQCNDRGFYGVNWV